MYFETVLGDLLIIASGVFFLVKDPPWGLDYNEMGRFAASMNPSLFSSPSRLQGWHMAPSLCLLEFPWSKSRRGGRVQPTSLSLPAPPGLHRPHQPHVARFYLLTTPVPFGCWKGAPTLGATPDGERGGT